MEGKQALSKRRNFLSTNIKVKKVTNSMSNRTTEPDHTLTVSLEGATSAEKVPSEESRRTANKTSHNVEGT